MRLAEAATPTFAQLRQAAIEKNTSGLPAPGLFREEAVEHHQVGLRSEGDLLRVDPAWMRWTYRLLLAVLVASVVFCIFARVREYASGPAVVRLGGRSDLTATADGTVTDVGVTTGQTVEAGRLLVRFYGAREAAELARIDHELELQLINRLRDPSDKGAEQNLLSLRAQRELARANLAEREVRAPAAGVVSDIRVRPGQHIAPGQSLLSLVRGQEHPQVICLLPGEFRPLLKAGMPLRLEVQGYRYAYQHLVVETVGDEVVGPGEPAVPWATRSPTRCRSPGRWCGSPPASPPTPSNPTARCAVSRRHVGDGRGAHPLRARAGGAGAGPEGVVRAAGGGRCLSPRRTRCRIRRHRQRRLRSTSVSRRCSASPSRSAGGGCRTCSRRRPATAAPPASPWCSATTASTCGWTRCARSPASAATAPMPSRCSPPGGSSACGAAASRSRRSRICDFLPPGSILHWQFNHFVVFERLTREGAEIVDPGSGRRKVSREELGRSFTGVALMFELGEDFEPQPGQRRRLGTASSACSRTTPGFSSGVLVTSAMVQLFALALPILIGVLVDRVIPQGDVQLLTVLGAGLAVIVGFSFLSSLLRSYLLLYLRTHLDARMTLDFLDHLVDLPYAFFQQRSAGDLIMRLSSNSTVREILTSGALSGVLDGLLVTIYLVLLFVASPTMGVLVLFLGAMRIGLFLFTRKRTRDLMSPVVADGVEVAELPGEHAGGHRDAQGRGAPSTGRWSSGRTCSSTCSTSPCPEAVCRPSWTRRCRLWPRASPLVILVWGAVQVLQGHLTLGTMLAMNALAAGFLTPLSTLITNAFQFQLLGSYLDRIEDVLETPREQDPRRG